VNKFIFEERPEFEFNKSYPIITMNNGKIARLTDRGFGFISEEGKEKDIFFHASELQGVEFNDLKEGDSVTFEVNDGPKGLNAVNVSLA